MEIVIADPNPNGPFDPAAYEELRGYLGVDLPKFYLEYLRCANGGKPADETFNVVPGDWGSAIDFCCTWSEDGVTDVFDAQGFWKIAPSFRAFLASLGPPSSHFQARDHSKVAEE